MFLASLLSSTIIGNPVPGVSLGEADLLVLQRTLTLDGATVLPCGGGAIALPVNPNLERFASGLPALPVGIPLCGLRLEGLSLHLSLAKFGGAAAMDLWVSELVLPLPAVRLSEGGMARLTLDLGAGDWLFLPADGATPNGIEYNALVAGLMGRARMIGL